MRTCVFSRKCTGRCCTHTNFESAMIAVFTVHTTFTISKGKYLSLSLSLSDTLGRTRELQGCLCMAHRFSFENLLRPPHNIHIYMDRQQSSRSLSVEEGDYSEFIEGIFIFFHTITYIYIYIYVYMYTHSRTLSLSLAQCWSGVHRWHFFLLLNIV